MITIYKCERCGETSNNRWQMEIHEEECRERFTIHGKPKLPRHLRF